MSKTIHPGKFFQEIYMKPQSLSIAEAARRLGVGRNTLSALVNESSSLSKKMAEKIATLTQTTKEEWLKRQEEYYKTKGYSI
jgi:addiction module HigA family antidote